MLNQDHMPVLELKLKERVDILVLVAETVRKMLEHHQRNYGFIE